MNRMKNETAKIWNFIEHFLWKSTFTRESYPIHSGGPIQIYELARYLCQIRVLAIWSREALAIYHLKSARGVDNMSTFSVKAPSAQPQDVLAGLR